MPFEYENVTIIGQKKKIKLKNYENIDRINLMANNRKFINKKLKQNIILVFYFYVFFFLQLVNNLEELCKRNKKKIKFCTFSVYFSFQSFLSSTHIEFIEIL